MATLNWKTPNGNSGNVDLDKIVMTEGNQTISGIKTFNNLIKFDTVGEIGYRGTMHTDPTKTCKQLYLTTGDFNEWSDAGAKMALHCYDENDEYSDGIIDIAASDGTNISELYIGRNGVDWNSIGISIDSIGSNYIRYNNNIQIVWDSLGCPDLPCEVTYPMPFVEYPRIGICNGEAHFTKWYYTGCTAIRSRGSYTSAYIRYIAIGKWK